MTDEVTTNEQSTGATLKAPAGYGWEPSPELQSYNKLTEQVHNATFAPIAQKLSDAVQSGTPEGNLEAAKIVKDVSSSNEVRWADVLTSLGRGDIGGIIKGITGGSDVRVPAYDNNGNQYYKVFNQRNELRRYETLDQKALSNDQVANIGAITSLNEVPMEHRAFFMAQGIGAKDVMAKQAQLWNNDQLAADAALRSAGAIRELSANSKGILGELVKNKNSINPATQILIAGANELSSVNSAEVQKNFGRLSKFAHGDGSTQGWEDFKKTSGGLTAGLNFTQGKGVTNSKGQTITDNDLQEMQNNAMSSEGIQNAIKTSQQNLIEKAQLLAAEGKIQNFDLIKQYINNQAQRTALINSIESNGGIGVFKPSLDYKGGDSFSLAYAKAVSDETYADLAEKFANKVFDVKKRYGSNVPEIGAVSRELANDKSIQERKKFGRDEVMRFYDENRGTFEELNKQPAYEGLMSKPSYGGVAPAEAPAQPNARTGQGNTEKPKAKAPQGGFNLQELIPIGKLKGAQ